MNRVYDIIKKLRIEKSISQDFMADKLGLSKNSYGRTERGETELTIERLEQIAVLLNTDIQSIVGMSVGEEMLAEMTSKVDEMNQMRARIERVDAEFERYKGQKQQEKLEQENRNLMRKYLTSLLLPAFIKTYEEADKILKDNGYDFAERLRDSLKEATNYMSDEDNISHLIETDKDLRDFLMSLVNYENFSRLIKK